jgi:hypothetical protein
VALPFTLKWIFKAKEEELWKLKYFTIHAKKYNLKKKILFEKPKFFKIYYNSIITNLKFQHKPKIYHPSKILIQK